MNTTSKRTFAALFAFLAIAIFQSAFSKCSNIAYLSLCDTTIVKQCLFLSPDTKHNKPYRIPALAQCKDKTLLAFSDYRPCGGDIGFGEVDIKLRRSEDGISWSEEVFVADGKGGEDNVFDCGFGDAAVVADRESNEVLVMCVAGRVVFNQADKKRHNFMARIRSTDSGRTWQQPEDITAMFMTTDSTTKPLFPNAHSMFIASGKILQSSVFKSEKSKYHRLYAALLIKDNRGLYNHVIYSDDFGESWHKLGNSCINGGDEAKLEELSDGTLVISSRKAHGRYFNVFTFSDIASAEGSWDKTVSSNDFSTGIKVGANSCNGELLRVKAKRKSDKKECELLLQSIPTGDNRTNVSIFFKELESGHKYSSQEIAQGWTKGIQISDKKSAYSTMILQQNGKIGFLYEEEPGDYSIVYTSLDIEQITLGLYEQTSRK